MMKAIFVFLFVCFALLCELLELVTLLLQFPKSCDYNQVLPYRTRLVLQEVVLETSEHHMSSQAWSSAQPLCSVSTLGCLYVCDQSLYS